MFIVFWSIERYLPEDTIHSFLPCINEKIKHDNKTKIYLVSLPRYKFNLLPGNYKISNNQSLHNGITVRTASIHDKVLNISFRIFPSYYYGNLVHNLCILLIQCLPWKLILEFIWWTGNFTPEIDILHNIIRNHIWRLERIRECSMFIISLFSTLCWQIQ